MNASIRFRSYGVQPAEVVLVHGGPGAAGEMAPVAKTLADQWGIIEPLQTATSVEGQIRELRATIKQTCQKPVVLAGFSWGAWLSCMVCARYSGIIRKLILISSGPFKEPYAEKVMDTRMNRLSAEERETVETAFCDLESSQRHIRTRAFRRLGNLMSKADAFSPLADDHGIIDYRPEIFLPVWRQAALLRQSGDLLAMVHNIQCPVTALHGEFDPHPAEGVRQPLEKHLAEFRFHLLKNCGHKPWTEAMARELFFNILRAEITDEA